MPRRTQERKDLLALNYSQGYDYCPSCKVFKPMNEFSTSKRKTLDVNPYCKDCFRIKRHSLYTRNQAKMRKLLGGVCQACGYKVCMEALTFYYVHPHSALFYLRSCRGLGKKVKKELSKCCLLCYNCTNELDAGLWSGDFVRASDKLGYYIRGGLFDGLQRGDSSEEV